MACPGAPLSSLPVAVSSAAAPGWYCWTFAVLLGGPEQGVHSPSPAARGCWALRGQHAAALVDCQPACTRGIDAAVRDFVPKYSQSYKESCLVLSTYLRISRARLVSDACKARHVEQQCADQQAPPLTAHAVFDLRDLKVSAMHAEVISADAMMIEPQACKAAVAELTCIAGLAGGMTLGAGGRHTLFLGGAALASAGLCGLGRAA